jgi:hypothetical protein
MAVMLVVMVATGGGGDGDGDDGEGSGLGGCPQLYGASSSHSRNFNSMPTSLSKSKTGSRKTL